MFRIKRGQKLRSKRTNSPINKINSFLKTEVQMDEKCMKKCPSFATREMQIKTALRFFPIPVRVFIIRKQTNKNKFWMQGNINHSNIHW
jgi:hypothetical protein